MTPNALPSGGHKRHAHDRADAEIDDALTELDAVVAAGVIAEERLRRFQTAADDGLAGPGVGLRPAAAAF